MAKNVLEQIAGGAVGLVGGALSGIGGGIRGATRALAPGWAKQSDIETKMQRQQISLVKRKQELEQLSFYLGIIKDQSATPRARKAAGDSIKRLSMVKDFSEQLGGKRIFGKPTGWGAGIVPPSMELTGAKVTPGASPELTYGRKEAFGAVPGPYRYIPETERPGVAREALTKPETQINISAGERQKIAETRASIDALDNLRTLFDNAQTKTGPITGRVSPLAGLVGMTTDEQEAFMAATSAFKNQVIKEITGAQMSEQEADRIMKQVPDITDPATRWNAKWEQSKKNLGYLQKRRLEILGQSGLQAPSKETQQGQAFNVDKQIADIDKRLAELTSGEKEKPPTLPTPLAVETEPPPIPEVPKREAPKEGVSQTEQIAFRTRVHKKAQANGISRATLYAEVQKLEPIWDEMSEEERMAAFEKLAEGATAQDIISGRAK